MYSFPSLPFLLHSPHYCVMDGWHICVRCWPARRREELASVGLILCARPGWHWEPGLELCLVTMVLLILLTCHLGT